MATKKVIDPSLNDGELTTKQKLDKLQRDIVIGVSVAAFVLGFMLIGSIYLVQSIIYKSRIVEANGIIIDTYKGIQTNLEALSSKVAALSSNENLESVAKNRDVTDCANFTTITNLEVRNTSEIERYKTCSSLRAITDALPTSLNSEATLASFNQLLNWSNRNLGVNFESIGAQSSTITSSGFSSLQSTNIHSVNTSVTLNDSSTAIRSALDMIENSIRNFDIVQANLNYSGDDGIRLTSTFSSYYSEPANLVEVERVVCANRNNEKCRAAGGDTKEAEERAARSGASSTTQQGTTNTN